MTIPAMLETVKFEGVYANTKFAKNLFLYDKKKKERLWLVICAHDTAFTMKALEKSFGVKNGDLRGADPEILESTLGVKGGSVNLFSIINDNENKVKLVIDHTLLNNYDYVGFHPMQNDFTTAIRRESVQKIIDLSHHEAQVLDFSTLEQATTTGDKKPEAGAKPAKNEKQPKKEEKKKEDAHQLGIEYTKEQNFSKWYS